MVWNRADLSVARRTSIRPASLSGLFCQGDFSITVRTWLKALARRLGGPPGTRAGALASRRSAGVSELVRPSGSLGTVVDIAAPHAPAPKDARTSGSTRPDALPVRSRGG